MFTMELLSPKLRALPSFVPVDSTVDQTQLWEIDSPSLEWSLGLAFLLSTVHKKNFSKSLCQLLKTKQRPRTDHWVPKTKRSVTKYNPFKNRYAVYNDRILRLILECLKIKLHSLTKGLEVTHFRLMKDAAKLFECVIILYDVDLTGKCQLLSIFSSSESIKDDAVKLFIFQHTSTTSKIAVEKFGFGLSLEFSDPLRQCALLHCLKLAKLTDEEIIKVKQLKCSNTNLLVRLLENDCGEILSSIYKYPLVTSRIPELGFNIDPCILDSDGFSSFYYCMGRVEDDWLMTLYNFATNRSRSSESSVRNPDSDILLALEKVGNLIKMDSLKSNYFLLLGVGQNTALTRCHWITYFNEYQREICKQILFHREHDVSMERNKNIMISLLETYSKYFYFGVLINMQDKFSFFEHFVKYCEFYEKLDYFTCLLFFDNLTGLIPLINETNSQIYYGAISSLFLAVLSNKYFPKHKQEICCFSCAFDYNCPMHSFEEKKCAQRFIPFHYRSRFLENAEALLVELKKTSSSLQQESTNTLLDVLKNSLTNFPEIVDEFIISRLRRYLLVVKDLQLKNFSVKNILTMERTLQVIGECLQNEPGCESVVWVLLESCISSELFHKFCNMRDHIFSKFRANAVQGRVKLEGNNGELLKNIQKELNDVDVTFRPVYVSQILRVEEFMTKEGKLEAQKICNGVPNQMSNQLKKFAFIRRELFEGQEDNFRYLTCNMFNHLYKNLDEEKFNKSKCMKIVNSLIFLLNFVVYHSRSSCIGSHTLKLSVRKLEKTLIKVKDKEITDEIKTEIKQCVSCNEDALGNIFENFKTELCFKFTFPCILSLKDRLKDFDIFSNNEKKCIVDRVSEYIMHSADLIRLLKGKLESGLVPEDMKNKLEEMIMPEDTRISLRNENKNALTLLNKVKEDTLNKLCSDGVPDFLYMKDREELVNMLLKINFPKPLKRKVISILNNSLWFLINRVDKLKKHLIFEDDSISFLWRSGKWRSEITVEKHMKFLMVRRFMTERDLQASLEMLIYDCFQILGKKRQDLKDLWVKTNDSFNGANLVDVLGHGNTILQTVGSVLIPEDLPSEFIEKVVELIKDRDSLRALSEFWEKTKLCKEEKFLEALRIQDNDEFSHLRTRIRSCGVRVEKYAKLLPLRW